uniref:Spectrin repeat containing, nuclear envelope 2b n=1 Tax=Salarias fasciatus TaxID=181472 RepID=A0A672F6F3_SALFA
QQLDKNMSNLRTWLSRIEAELAKPVVYDVCHSEEIQRKLAEQQDLQRDIEQHTDSVASVLMLCDVLLHDAEACGSDSENDSIQQTRADRGDVALWCKFLDDYSRFEDWLKTAELTAASPESADVLYTCAKEELKKFEVTPEQTVPRLARENRTDASSRLRVLVQEGNWRWDVLQRRVGCHFTSQREDFEGTREAILVWLTEMDLQLTDVEHFSESDIEDKMRQLNGFQQEITSNTNKIDALIVFGENLIQKSAPAGRREVFGRVARFHQRLVSRRAGQWTLLQGALQGPWGLSIHAPGSVGSAGSGGGVKLMSECSGSIDSVKRVKLILNDDEELEEAGLTGGVIERWELLLAQEFSGDSDVRQDVDQWDKLNSDLCAVTSWLGGVLPELEALQRIAPASSVRHIEANVRKLKCRETAAVQHAPWSFRTREPRELQELQEALSSANQSWTQACGGVESWERKLQAALLQCQVENGLQDMNGGEAAATPRSVLLQRRHTLTTLQEELQARQQQVSSLQDISSQLLLLDAGGDDGLEAREKVHVIGNKLQLLLRRTAAELQEVTELLALLEAQAGTVLSTCLKSNRTSGHRVVLMFHSVVSGWRPWLRPPARPFLSRVLRAAFPLHLLLLVLLLLVCLVPLSDDAYSCTLSNNFARSFYPMLRYTNGPPPT